MCPRLLNAAHKPMLTIVFPEDLCAAEINIRFMANLIGCPLYTRCGVCLWRHEIQCVDADGGDQEGNGQAAKAQQEFIQ